MKIIKSLFLKCSPFFLLACIFYGFSLLYYQTTDGFALRHITLSLPFDDKWEVRTQTEEEAKILKNLLKQPFHYIGKGCQSYVFASEDNKYVIKFFKFQRMREKEWLNTFNFIPFFKEYAFYKNDHKRLKREGAFKSWKLAFNELAEETGTLFVHLNKTNLLKTSLKVTDKVGVSYDLWLDDYQFMIQKKAVMLCESIDTYMSNNEELKADLLLKKLLSRILSEYHRGYADNDHALMQNTGVCEGDPLHIDIGQFVWHETIKDSNFHLQELFTKTYKFRKWLQERYPSLNQKFEGYLKEVIGPQFETMRPFWREKMEIFQSE